MRQKLVFIFLYVLFLLISHPLLAQNTTHSWKIEFQNSVGYTQFKNTGTSPLTYSGPTTNLGINITLLTPENWYRINANANLFALLSRPLAPHFGTLGATPQIQLEYFHSYSSHSSLGGGITETFLIFNNNNFRNASLGIGNFLNLNLAYQYTHSLKRQQVFAKIAISPVSFAFTPGYAFVDNYTSSLPSSSTYFTDYSFSFIPLNFIQTNLGILFPKRHLSLSYNWEFLTTWNFVHNRLDIATHNILLTWQINHQQ